MKRILALVLALILVTIPLSGCTASQITREDEETQSASETSSGSTVVYRSGENETTAFSCILRSETDNGDGTFSITTVDKYDIIDVLDGKATCSWAVIPTLTLDGPVTASFPTDGKIESVVLYTACGGEFSRGDVTLETLQALDFGTYYVAVYVQLSGSDSDGRQYTSQYEDVFRLVVAPTDTAYEATVRFLEYKKYWDGYEIATKTVSGIDVSYRIVNALKDMAETGEIVGKISDDVIPEGGVLSDALPVEPGTTWIEADGALYRMTADLSSICRVETHLGEGRVLKMTDVFKTYVAYARNYAPNDFYSGIYQNGDDAVTLHRVYISGSTIDLRIKDIKIENAIDPQNTITVELISTVDQTVTVTLECQQSQDNLARGDKKNVELKSGVAETVTLTFGGWKYNYWIYIKVGNTVASIAIEP